MCGHKKRRIEQEVETPAPVILPEGGQEVVDIEVLPAHLDLPPVQFLAVIVPDILVEGIKGRHDTTVCRDPLDIGGNGTAEFPALGLAYPVVIGFPQCQQQGLDAVLLFHVVLVIVGIERVKTDRVLFRVRVIDPVPPFGFPAYHLAKALIRVTRIDQDDVRALLPVLSYHVVHEKGLARPGRAQHEFIPVGGYSAFHRKVGNIHVQGLARNPVAHLYTERRRRGPIVRFLREET